LPNPLTTPPVTKMYAVKIHSTPDKQQRHEDELPVSLASFKARTDQMSGTSGSPVSAS
jgi:hypothetical protein